MLFPSFARSSSNIFTFLSRRCAPWAAALTIALAALCPAARAQTAAPQQQAYTITDLGVLPGGGYFPGQNNYKCYCSYGNGINASGQVTGYAAVPIYAFGVTNETQEAVIFSQGKVKGLGFLPGGVLPGFSYGSAINGYGDVTGTSSIGEGGQDAFLYSGGKIKDLGVLSGDVYSNGLAINDAGQVAGTSSPTAMFGLPPIHAFLYSDGTTSNLGTIPGSGGFTFANGINSSGQVTGYALAGYAPYAEYLVLFSGGKVINLGLPDGATGVQGNGSNDLGEITGQFATPKPFSHAFIYSNGVFTDIGKLPGDEGSVGYAINISGQIVGVSYSVDNGNVPMHPFLYTPGQGMVSLNSLLPAGSGWKLDGGTDNNSIDDNVTGINDKGQITGTGTNPEGFQRAYLLSPVFVPFSTLDAVVDILGPSKTTFAVGGRFVLGAKSNGIDLLKDTAVLQLGGYHISLPPSSFVEKNGIYTYNGKVGNVTLQVTGRQVGKNVYLFGVLGQGAAGLPTSYPLNLVLTIGNDTGSEEIKDNYGAGNLTEAEVCRNLGLTCAN